VSPPISDFSDADERLVAGILERRYGKPVLPDRAEAELALDPARETVTVCPTLYWSERGAHFVVCKVGEGKYRCQFFYGDVDHYGTGRETYDDLALCVRTLLQVQADHERASAGVSAGATSADLCEDAYDGPPVL